MWKLPVLKKTVAVCCIVTVCCANGVEAKPKTKNTTQNKRPLHAAAKLLSKKQAANQFLFQALRGSNYAQVQRALANGAAANARDKNGVPALFYAAATQRLDITKLLIDKGAAINATPPFGGTVLIYGMTHRPLLKLLLERGADPNVRLPNDRPRNDMSFPNNRTLLMPAVMYTDAPTVELLLKHGAQVNATDAAGMSALMWLGMRWMPRDKPGDKSEIAKMLLAKGANPNAKSKDGMTPLMAASNGLNLEVAQALVAAGAQVNATNKEGNTALFMATESATNTFFPERTGRKFLKFLLDHGANPNKPGRFGQTPIDEAEVSGRKDLVALLRTGKTPGPKRNLPRPVALAPQMKPLLPGEGNEIGYVWKSTSELLILRKWQKGDQSFNNWYRHDLQTGHEERLASLDPHSQGVVFLPNGQWTLTHLQTADDKDIWKAVGLDSGQTRHGSLQTLVQRYSVSYVMPNQWTWLPDSKRWVWPPESLDSTIAGGDRLLLLVFNLDSPKVREVKIEVQNKVAVRDKGPMLPAIILGFTAPTQVLSTAGSTFNQASQRSDLYTFDISKPKPRARRIDVALPAYAEARPILSPQGTTLPWVLQVEDGDRDYIEFWLSRADGTQMRGLGSLEVTDLKTAPNLDTVQWRPDGKEISLVMNDSLYTVPTE